MTNEEFDALVADTARGTAAGRLPVRPPPTPAPQRQTMDFRDRWLPRWAADLHRRYGTIPWLEEGAQLRMEKDFPSVYGTTAPGRLGRAVVRGPLHALEQIRAEIDPYFDPTDITQVWPLLIARRPAPGARYGGHIWRDPVLPPGRTIAPPPPTTVPPELAAGPRTFAPPAPPQVRPALPAPRGEVLGGPRPDVRPVAEARPVPPTLTPEQQAGVTAIEEAAARFGRPTGPYRSAEVSKGQWAAPEGFPFPRGSLVQVRERLPGGRERLGPIGWMQDVSAQGIARVRMRDPVGARRYLYVHETDLVPGPQAKALPAWATAGGHRPMPPGQLPSRIEVPGISPEVSSRMAERTAREEARRISLRQPERPSLLPEMPLPGPSAPSLRPPPPSPVPRAPKPSEAQDKATHRALTQMIGGEGMSGREAAAEARSILAAHPGEQDILTLFRAWMRKRADRMAPPVPPPARPQAAPVAGGAPTAVETAPVAEKPAVPEEKLAPVPPEPATKDVVLRPPREKIPDAEDPTWLAKASLGRMDRVSTPTNRPLDVQYAIVELRDLRKLPELQPRERARDVSELQIRQIVDQFIPERMGPNPLASEGAIQVGPDGAIEAGHGRSEALRRIYEGHPDKAKAYRDFLVSHAQTQVGEMAGGHGVDPARIAAMKEPVLVRVRKTPVEDRAALARDLNVPTVLGRSASETAKGDAELLDGELMSKLKPLGDNIEASLKSIGNKDFVQDFLGRLPIQEVPGMLDSQGLVSSQGIRRLRDAIAQKVYGDQGILGRVAESASPEIRNVSKGLLDAAPLVADLHERAAVGMAHPLSPVPDLVQAVNTMAKITAQGGTVERYLTDPQVGLFGGERLTPVQQRLLRFLDANKRSAKKIRELIETFVIRVQGLGVPQQETMFGKTAVPTVEQVWERVLPPATGGSSRAQ